MVKTNRGTDNLPDTILVLAAHGSTRDARINATMFTLARRIADYGGFQSVTPAFLDGQPNLSTIMHEVAAPRAVVIPFMASAGYYTDVVFPQSFAGSRVDIRIAEPIGNHPALTELVRRRIESVLARVDETQDCTVVVVGHGTRKNKKSCRTTIDLVHSLRHQIAGPRIEFAFIDQNPSVDHTAAKMDTSLVLVVPFLMGLGPHVTVDVPAAFGLGDITEDVFAADFQFPLIRTVELPGGDSRTLAFDAPIGLYPEWAEICQRLAVAKARQFQEASQ